MSLRRLAGAAVLLGLLALTGCWPQVGYGPENQRWNPLENQLTLDNVATLTQSWAAPSDQLLLGFFDGGAAQESVVWGGRVFVTDSAHGAVVKALDEKTGATLWQRSIGPPTDATATASSVAIVGNDVMVTWAGLNCTAGEVRLDAATGAVIQEATTTPVTRGAPVPFGARFAQEEYSLPPDSCNQVTFGNPPWQTDIVVRDTASGAVLWRDDVTPSGAHPAVGGGHLVVGSSDTFGYDAAGCGQADCQPLWHVGDMNMDGQAVIVGDHAFQSGNGELRAVDLATGATTVSPTGIPSGDLVYANGVLYNSVNLFDGTGGVLLAFDPKQCAVASCQPLWSAPLPTWTANSVGWHVSTAAGGVLYLYSYDVSDNSTDGIGRVIAVDPSRCAAHDCNPVWDSGVFTGIAVSTSVSDGRLFVIVRRDNTTLPDLVVSYAPIR